jgi:nucleoside-diphosphate-sugar epimerase
MRVFLTGANGYEGSAICAAALEAGHTVVGLVLNEKAAAQVREAGASPLVGDLRDGDLLAHACSEVDAVIHNALPNDATAAHIDRLATVNMLAALEGTGKAFVYTSGGWVLGNSDSEDSPPIVPPAIWWRPSLEQVVLADADQDVRVAIIRPGIIYGGRGGLVEMMISSAAEDGKVKVFGDGKNSWMFVYRDDLASLYILAAEKAPSRAILLGASSTEKIADVAASASRVAGGSGEVELQPVESAPEKMRAFAEVLTYDQRAVGQRALALGWKPVGPSVFQELERRMPNQAAA